MSAPDIPAHPGVLAADESPPFEIVTQGARPIVIVCDHAANRVPRSLDMLGLPAHRFEDHIAWDIGAAGVARHLLTWFEASGVLACYSRLVVDLNRSLGDGSAFPQLSDGIVIPANIGLGQEAAQRRIQALYLPYHNAVSELVAARIDAQCEPVFIAIHSFTPRQHGVARPWHVGVLWDKDPRLPVGLLQGLRALGDLVVADNEPYSGRHAADYTVDHHAEPLGIAHACIEIRQDLIRDAAGQQRVAAQLADALRKVLDMEALYDPAQSWLRNPRR
jgi:predicted N-formylglutamate amidohydrolase